LRPPPSSPLFPYPTLSRSSGLESVTVTATEIDNDGAENPYIEEFLEQYQKISNFENGQANGYFSPEGVPYHSVETLMVEAPDHGDRKSTRLNSSHVKTSYA